PSYTGLITRKGETWSIPIGQSPSQVQSVSRTEDYVYDYAARLSAWDDSSNGEDISYDARGNITSRSPRHGSGGTVTMTYTGDRLATRKVGTAPAVSFAHDSFARMTTDAGAGLSITYNALDLPERISQGTALKAKYTYLADGTKVSTLDASGAGLVYRGPFTYRRSSGGTLTFESAPFDRGRLTEAGARYHVTDHLGSVRAVIDGNASMTTYPLAGFYSVDDFAPYGTKSTSGASSYLSPASTGSTVSLRDGFTGKEEQGPDFGVGYIDFGARQYSPTLSRWLVPDPMGEKYYDISPYAYCAGNPVNLVDPTGEFLYIGDYLFFQGRLFDQTGELIDIKELDEFTLDAFNALAEINTTAVGRELVDELQYSDFTFIIRSAEFSQFKRDNTQGSVGNLIQQSREDQVVGSGGTIFWNSEGSPLFTQKGLLINATTDLAHEMFHGMDANHGVLDNRLYKRIKKDEWQAVYNENRLRKELGLPLRTYYMKGIDSEGVLHPVGARMIRWGKPKELNWYK
ncbi:MAG: hypothetical protein IJ202_05385, partial [Bacteroidales bacterium]|nr:hypothetical protein [Bacteroidales bacterium]